MANRNLWPMLKVDESSFCPKIVQNHNFARKGPSKMSENVVNCGAKEEDHDSHATIICDSPSRFKNPDPEQKNFCQL